MRTRKNTHARTHKKNTFIHSYYAGSSRPLLQVVFLRLASLLAAKVRDKQQLSPTNALINIKKQKHTIRLRSKTCSVSFMPF